jgi:hypothetical protein
MDNGFEIRFEDLTKNCQRRLLAYMGISTPAQANWDVYHIAEIYKDDDEES